MEKVQLARNLDQREIVATKRNCQPFAARYTIFAARYTIFVYQQEPVLKINSIFCHHVIKLRLIFFFSEIQSVPMFRRTKMRNIRTIPAVFIRNLR